MVLRNEETTIESVIDISPLVDGLVDELIVLWTSFTDDTESGPSPPAPGLSAT